MKRVICVLAAACLLGLAGMIPVGAVREMPVFSTEPMLSAGTEHSLALRYDGTVWGWGRNDEIQLGDGGSGSMHQTTPVLTRGLRNIVAVEAGNAHSLALRDDGTLWYFGKVESPEHFGFGRGEWTGQPFRVPDIGNVAAISVSGSHRLALKDDGTVWRLWCFIPDDTGENGTWTHVQVEGLSDITAISAGNSHGLALHEDGSVWAWGGNDAGQIGDGNYGLIEDDDGIFAVTQPAPVRVEGLSGVTAIAAGWDFSLALREDGTVWQWGITWIRWGTGQGGEKRVPTQVRGLENVTAIATSGKHSLALREDGSVWAWGLNESGQLGLNRVGRNASVPAQVRDLNLLHADAPAAETNAWPWLAGGGALAVVIAAAIAVSVVMSRKRKSAKERMVDTCN